ncbi:MAG: hypothetical protein J6R89_01100, partial [Clostridia bacterium]|nr:hypothetical protein [Clostridia bacterium]
MKKRILSLLLVIGTLLTLFPVMGVAADEVLPKDETPGATSQSASDGFALSEYEKLYVGANGEKTALGGELVALYSTFGDSAATVDLTAGKWADKMGGADATLRGGEIWQKLTRGIGYDFPQSELTTHSGNYGIDLPEALLTPDLYVETLGKVNSFTNPDGTLQSNLEIFYNNRGTCAASFARVDLLSGVFFICLSGGNQDFGNRWFLCYRAFGTHFGNNPDLYQAVTPNDMVYASAARNNGNKPTLIGAYYERTTDSEGAETYAVGFSTGERFATTISAAEKARLATYKNGSDKAGVLSFFNGIPSEAHVIRVYSAPLTEAERVQNAVVDILAYAGADISAYAKIDATKRAVINNMLAVGGFAEDKESMDARLNELLALFETKFDLDKTLYVTDGLIFLASAYENYATGHHGSDTLNWVNAVDLNQSASLQGGYKPGEKGGYTIVKTNDEFMANKTYGIYMPSSVLPAEDYTVEFAFNPVGLTVTNENGELERYIDDKTATGTHANLSTGIGPLRCLQFICYRPSGDGQMERRWVYRASGDISSNPGWSYEFKDTAWKQLEMYEVVSFSIVHDYENRSSDYAFYNNGEEIATYAVDPENYISTAEAGNMFRLLVGMPGTVYSVRVYDRPLSETEVMRNKMADLICYYDLDATKVVPLIKQLGDDAGMMYQAVCGLSTTLTKEQAQAELDKMIATIWVAFEGIGVRKDLSKEATRYYFTCNANAVLKMANAGYKLEIGALVNVDKNVSPVLAEDAYDYKIVTYGSAAGRNNAFFVDDDTFAVTVQYENTDRFAGTAKVYVRGYVKLTGADGSETIYYMEPKAGAEEPDSLFAVYEIMKNHDEILGDAPLLG